MKHKPEKCPLCLGEGIVKKYTLLPDLINRGNPDKPCLLDCKIEKSKCLNCNGTGLVIDTGRYSPIIQIA